ncbi:MAG: L-lactate dehydrogenase [Oscillospiraceae bacterium]|nr:L-lactate dehydrogenase [Oscillospiraceae bacterium]
MSSNCGVDIRKCAIIGCGFVGASIAFRFLESGLFSEMVLIDVNKDKSEGEALDLAHGIPFTRPMSIYSGSYDDLEDCAVVVITAGGAQKPGQTRTDLVDMNIGIFKKIIPEITKRNKDCILLVVSNPCDVLTYAALKISGFPANRVIGSGTVLDTARLKYLLGNHLDVDPRNVHAFIIGEHGDSELAVWSSASVSGVDLREFCRIFGKSSDESVFRGIYEDVRDSAYEIIRKKSATYYAIAMAVERICECIVRDEHSVLTVSSLSNGHYGIDDICLGLPAVVGREGVEKLLDIPLSPEEQSALENSASEMRQYLSKI